MFQHNVQKDLFWLMNSLQKVSHYLKINRKYSTSISVKQFEIWQQAVTTIMFWRLLLHVQRFTLLMGNIWTSLHTMQDVFLGVTRCDAARLSPSESTSISLCVPQPHIIHFTSRHLPGSSRTRTHARTHTNTCYDAKRASKLCKARLLQRDNEMKELK